MNSIFEVAARNKTRFQSIRGLLSVEQLWDVPLRSKDGFNLNAIAQKASVELKESSKESFVDDPVEKEGASLPLHLVKHIIKVKLEEETTRKKAASTRLERQNLLRILAEKKDGALTDLSVAELEERIRSLG